MLGPASDRLLHQTTESLAGRVRYIEATHRIVVHAGELTIPLRGDVTAIPLHAAVESLREAGRS